MEKQKILFITAKKSYLENYIEAYEEIKNTLSYLPYFAVANNCIIDITLPFYRLTEEEINNMPTVCLNGKELDSKFRFASSPLMDEFSKKYEDIIKTLLKENEFDVIVNACDTDEEGELQFAYTLDSLNLKHYRIIKPRVNDLRKEALQKVMMYLL